jgi:hypothetical protein
VSENDYYRGANAAIDVYMDRAMYGEARSRVWKRAAKNKLEEVQILQRAEKDYEEQLRKCYATATRRKELLIEVRQLLDMIYAEDIVSSDDLGKVYAKVEKEELADD